MILKNIFNWKNKKEKLPVFPSDIAIVGMSCRFPGANNYDEYWQNLIGGINSIREIPNDRWDWQAYWGDINNGNNTTTSKWGGFINDIDKFDPTFFNISPSEAELMDPQQRIILELAWSCLEDAGYAQQTLKGSNTGVFIGACNFDYKELLTYEVANVEGHVATGNYNCMLANRISYIFGFHGPSLTIDTACASSLYAIHYAVQSLLLCECEVALAGGISILCTPTSYISFSKRSMLSPTGQCYAFDAAADGYVRGEGGGVILLKPLSKAIAANDRILGVIKATAVNHGGSVRTITSPNHHSQARVILNAWEKAGISADKISYIEAHGTGTPLGDPLEIYGLQKAFKQSAKKHNVALGKGYCAIGTVKTNIGHLESAAGIAGIIKILLAFQHKRLPRLQNYKKINSKIELSNSPFYLLEQEQPWNRLKDKKGRELVRYAGISSCGFGGANAHIALAEASYEILNASIQNNKTNVSKPAYLLTLSAKDFTCRQQRLYDLQQWLKKYSKKCQLADVSYTLNMGRDHFEYRCFLIAESLEQLEESLQKVLTGDRISNCILTETKSEPSTEVKTNFNEIEKQLFIDINTQQTSFADYRNKLFALGNLYIKGHNPDWKQLYRDEEVKRIALPTYPFVRERYWIPDSSRKNTSTNTLTGRNSFPLVVNAFASSLDKVCYKVPLTGKEEYFKDHIIAGRKLLPSSVYLELVRFAYEFRNKLCFPFSIRQIVWISALFDSDREQELEIVLSSKENTIFYEIQNNGYLYCQGELVNASEKNPDIGSGVPLSLLLNQFSKKISRETLYSQFRSLGFNYGPSMQTLQWVKTDSKAIIGYINLSKEFVNGYQFHILHPSLLDGALQTVLALSLENKVDYETILLPFSIQKLIVCKPLTDKCYVYAQSIDTHNEKTLKYNVKIISENREILIEIIDLVLRPFSLAKSKIEASTLEANSKEHMRVQEKHTTNSLVDKFSKSEERNSNNDSITLVEQTQDYLKLILCKVLKLSSRKVTAETSFDQLGIDSIFVLRLTQELEKVFGTLPKTLFFEYQAISELAKYFIDNYKHILSSKFFDISNTNEKAEYNSKAAKSIDEIEIDTPWREDFSLHQMTEKPPLEDIAIIGLSGRYPMAKNLDEFWENLKIGKDCIIEIPKERWDYNSFFSQNKNDFGKTYSKWGSFIDGFDNFDPLFFNISPKEAELMDPQERVFLEVAWETLEDAGYTQEQIGRFYHSNSVGVFVGVMYTPYQLYGSEETLKGNPIALNSSAASIANRVSYCLNFRGPSLAVDTMCSSSLTAIHLACESIRRRECKLALAGGVNIASHANKYSLLSQSHFLSTDGKCKSFGKNGDGYVPGEGVGAVLLKPLSLALQDGDHIYGIIKGSGINHGGKTNGFYVPNPGAQAEVIKGVLHKFQIDPLSISYIEAHGTGTALGDPIEVQGLHKALGDLNGYICPIGSIKSNIGHLEAAAGIAGLTKILLQLKHQLLVPSLHSDELNPNIDFTKLPFRIQQSITEWQTKSSYPRRACISAFGAGGSNAHIIIEEAPTNIPHLSHPKPYYLVALSAKQQNSLDKKISALYEWLLQHSSHIELPDLAYTLNAGREHYRYRCAFIVTTITDLTNQLFQNKIKIDKKNYLYGDNADLDYDPLTTKQTIPELQEKLASLLEVTSEQYRKYMQELAEWYVKGNPLDWQLLHNNESKRKLSLPTYPFLFQRYWFPTKSVTVYNRTSLPSFNKLHPLISYNASTLQECRFKLIFDEEDIKFYGDHQVNAQVILPGAVFLEIARAAGDNAKEEQSVAKLKQIVWISPLALKPQTQLNISLKEKENCIDFVAYSENELEKTIHCQGEIIFNISPLLIPSVFSIHKIEDNLKRHISKETLYTNLAQTGLNYGSHFKCLEWIKTSGQEALGYLSLSPELKEKYDRNRYFLHPCLVDSAFQSIISLMLNDEAMRGKLLLPFTLNEVILYKSLPDRCYVYATKSKNFIANLPSFDLQLINENGETLVSIQGFVVKELNNPLIKNDLIKNDIAQLSIYSTVWREQPLISKNNANLTQPSHLLIVDNNKNVTVNWPAMKTTYLFFDKEYRQLTDNSHQIRADVIEDYEKFFSQLNQPISHVLFIATNASTVDHSLTVNIRALFLITKALQKNKSQAIRLLYVYQGERYQPIAAMALGFARSIKKEYPVYQYKVIHIDTSITINSLYDELLTDFKNDLAVSHKENTRYIQKFIPIRNYNAVSSPILLRHRGVYLVTGGLGGLGAIFARYLLENYSANVLLIGRSNLNDQKEHLLHELKRLPGNVQYMVANVAVREDIVQVIEIAKQRFGSINGIIHSAGVIKDGFVIKKSLHDFNEVLIPKVYGSLLLDEVTNNEKLDFFILFSSIAACLGNTGQSDYASANTFMDTFSFYRNLEVDQGKRWGRTIAIDWPLWAEGGMQVTNEQEQFLLANFGLLPLPTHLGIDIFKTILELTESQVVVGYGKPAALEKELNVEPVVMKELRQISTTFSEVNTNISDLNDEDILLKRKLIANVEKKLIHFASTILKIDTKEIDRKEDLINYGTDSIAFVNIANKINAFYQITISPATFYEYTNIERVAEYLIDSHIKAIAQIYKEESPIKPIKKESIEITDSIHDQTEKANMTSLAQPVFVSETQALEINDDIAIIGMQVIFPQSADLDEFWQHLIESDDLISEVPIDRWDWRKYVDQHVPKWGGFIEGIDLFDADFFNISPREAELMDPQHRLFMQVAWQAIEDAGYSIAELNKTKTGLFVGVSTYDYSELLAKQQLSEMHTPTGIAHSILANRISFLFNLTGPSETVDTACSSSLVAMHRAVRALQAGDCEVAIVGGVNALLTPNLFISFTKAGMLSQDGRCKTFDKAANGYVRGEGAAAIVIKPLKRAHQDGDHIYAVIKTSNVNHGGHVNTLTAPNPQAQAELIIEAYKRANISPTTVSYIEAHGTGTALGDPIEINGLKKAFAMLAEGQGEVLPNHFCGIGSIKSNIGHLEAAAGMASVIKVLLMLKHKRLPKQNQFKDLNPYIELEQSPFYIVTESQSWEATQNSVLRRAGISSFGFGGTNAHVLLEEAPSLLAKNEELVVEKPAYLLTFSAKHMASLKQKLIDFARWLNDRTTDTTLGTIAYNLNCGREQFKEARCMMVVGSISEITSTLVNINQNQKADNYLFSKTNENIDESLLFLEIREKLIEELPTFISKPDSYRRKLLVLGELYVRGYDLDWKLLSRNDNHQRLSIPVYPFQKQRYWVPKEQESFAQVALLHPLIDQNVSTFDTQAFCKTFSANDLICLNHQINNKSILAGAVYIGMLDSALRLSKQDLKGYQLNELYWLRPLYLSNDSTTLKIVMSPSKLNQIKFEIVASKEPDIYFVEGSIDLMPTLEIEPITDIAAISNRLTEVIDYDRIYQRFAAIGMQYSGNYRVLDWIKIGSDNEILAKLSIDKNEIASVKNQHTLYPPLLDGAFQAIIGLSDIQEDKHVPALLLPYRIEKMYVYGDLNLSSYCYINRKSISTYDIKIYNEEGKIIIALYNFELKEILDSSNKSNTKKLLLILEKYEQGLISNKEAVNQTEQMLMMG